MLCKFPQAAVSLRLSAVSWPWGAGSVNSTGTGRALMSTALAAESRMAQPSPAPCRTASPLDIVRKLRLRALSDLAPERSVKPR